MLPQGRLLFALFCEFSSLLYRVVGHLCIRMAEEINALEMLMNLISLFLGGKEPLCTSERASFFPVTHRFTHQKTTVFKTENDGFFPETRRLCFPLSML